MEEQAIGTETGDLGAPIQTGIRHVSQMTIIAVVDDDAAILSAMSSLIRSLGYAVLTFASAEAFLASPDLRNVACLVSDVQLPGGLNGFELHEALVQRHIPIPVVLMTGLSDDQTRARATRSGAFAFMQKPVDDDALIKCLGEACASKPSAG